MPSILINGRILSGRRGNIRNPLVFLPLREMEKRRAKDNPEYIFNSGALEGEEWRRVRRILDQKLLVISQVQKYTSRMNDIGDDMIKLIKNQLHNGYLPNLEHFCYTLSVEGIGSVLFDYRLRVLSENIPEKSKQFLETLERWNHLLQYLLFSFPWYLYFDTPTWKQFINTSIQLEQIASHYVKMADELNKNKPAEERIDLFHFLKQEGLSEQEATVNTVSMFIGGSDTTRYTLLWLIYNLGRFPLVQQTLREEINSVVRYNTPITSENLKQLKYLRNTIKESMRLTPVTYGVTRVLDDPIVVSGYEIPPKTPILLPFYRVNKNPQYFPDPYNFKPERFFTEENPIQKWVHLPFGAGPRMCQGFRVSELEMYIAIAKLVQNFEWKSEEEVEPIEKLTIVPERKLKIHWKPLQ